MSCQPEYLIHANGHWWNRVLDSLLPPRCLLCGLSCGSICICDACLSELPRPGSSCYQCALPVGSESDLICGACIKKKPPFDSTVTPLLYDFPVDRLVKSFKYRRQLTAGRLLSRLLIDYVLSNEIVHPDILIPVPMHHFRLIKRGFNQAGDICSYASKVLGIAFNTHSLKRKRHTKAQSGLSSIQRRKNLRGAFCWNGRSKPPDHVALIDDVMTTGTTVAECTRILKKAGAKRVDVWVAARAVPSDRR